MKTERYFMETQCYELSLSGTIEITKSKYNEMMKNAKYLMNINNTKCENGYETQMNEYEKDRGNCTTTTTFFSNCVTDFILIKIVCKDGYKFK